MKLSLFGTRSIPALFALLVLGAGLSGCTRSYDFSDPAVEGGYVGSDSGASGDGETQPPLAPTPDQLGIGDRINLVFSGNPNAPHPHTEQIREDGFITPPLLGINVYAAGKTIGQLQRELLDLYVPAFFPMLTVTVRSEDRQISVGGHVHRPGPIIYRSDMTVLKAIQAAGDFTNFANRRRVLVTRQDGTLIEVDCRRALRDSTYDVQLYPGDRIHVQQRW
jgi:protein involved in polysaccharide export with SLBB domain